MGSDNQKQFNAVIIVEGRNDTKRLKQFFPRTETIEANGSEVSDQTLVETKKLVRTGEIIIFTDPNYNDERIRRLMTSVVSNVKQVLIAHKEGEPTKRGSSLGTEHASKKALIRTLGGLHEIQAIESDITKERCDDSGLVVSPEAHLSCERVGIKLETGYGDSRQFLKRLKMFGITYDKSKRAVEGVKQYVNC